MFQTFVALLTAATFVAHGLLGCCWHHTHSHACAAEVAVAKSGGCQGHGHDHAHRSAGEPVAEHDDRQDRDSGAPRDPDCDEEHCVFVRVQDSVKSVADAYPAVVPYLGVGFPLDRAVRAVTDAPGLAALGEAPPLPAPLYALRQVWLI